MEGLIDYIYEHKTVCLMHPLNIPKYNIISGLIGMGIFSNKKLLMVTDNKDNINKCFRTQFSDDIFYEYSDNLPNVDNKSYIIVDSITKFCDSDKITKFVLDNINKCCFIFLSNIELSRKNYEKYEKISSKTYYLKMNFCHTHPHIKYSVENSKQENIYNDDSDDDNNNNNMNNIMKYILLRPFERQIIYTSSIGDISDKLKNICDIYRKRIIIISKDDERHSIDDKFAAWSSSKINGLYVMLTDILPKNNLYSITLFHIYGTINKNTYYSWLDKIYRKNLHNFGYDNLNIIFHIYDDKSRKDYSELSGILSNERSIYKRILDSSDMIVNNSNLGFCVRKKDLE